VGSAIKRRLLNHFGSARGVRQAGLADLEACPGIGPAVARRIHEHFHPGAAAPRAGGPPAARQGVAAPAEPSAMVAPRERTG
jgi:excinuclease ABC subunit C